MTLITIRQTGSINDSPNATLSFNYVGQYVITINNPFSAAEEERLEWYFERYLKFPFIESVKADQARESIKGYGRTLFEQVFGDREARAKYSTASQEGLENLCVEIIGSPEFFHLLHWEALNDPNKGPIALEVPLVRNTLKPRFIEAKAQSSPTIRLLIVTARPNGRSDIGYRTVSRPLVESMRRAAITVKIDILRPGTYEALIRQLEDVRNLHGKGYYHIIHFDLHGTLATYQQMNDRMLAGLYFFHSRYERPDCQPYEGRKAFLLFETTELGQADPAEAQEIAELLQKHSIPIAILNACQSGKQTEDSESTLGSRLLEAGVQTVVAMSYSVTIEAAALMMTELYRQLFNGTDLPGALCHARKALHDNKNRKAYYDQTIELEDWMLPVIYQNDEVQNEPPFKLRPFTSVEEIEYRMAQSKRYQAPMPTYGFFGRDLDILEIERKLLIPSEDMKRNLLLLQGMGGSGKTTLLKHLMEWWQTTGFVQEVFYFGYDERAWNLEQIMNKIAQNVLADRIDAFRALDLASQQKVLGKEMRSQRHLLVMDNMESITGSSMAIRNTLSNEEQQELKEFLAELLGGDTMVLLGSRSNEEWLAEGYGAPLRKRDVYNLPGLDEQAACDLAERVLERNVEDPMKRESYRRSTEFQKLMDILDGYPLPIQVVLANLAHQEPAGVLKALITGEAIEDSKIKDKTESIILCIEYSHSNLEPDDQKLLLCLALFSGVVVEALMKHYIERLKAQPALTSLPFDRWIEVLKEAQKWGLITRDKTRGILRLQPVLPYFLCAKLNLEPDIRQAVETAFRNHYCDVGAVLTEMMQSDLTKEKQDGQKLTSTEYENLCQALELDIKAHDSILFPFSALSNYLDATHDQKKALMMGQKVQAGLEEYPPEILKGQIGVELVGVLDYIAKCYLQLEMLTEAETTYKRALELNEQNIVFDNKTKAVTKAGICFQLGIVAQEQRHWEEAEKCYNKAQEIFIEFGEHLSQAGTYHQLGILAQRQRHWEDAEYNYKAALRIFIRLAERSSQASTYFQMGVLAGEQQKWNTAIGHYTSALNIYLESNNRYNQANVYHQMGIVMLEQKQWTEAKNYYEKALKISIELKDRAFQANIYHNLGRVAEGQEQWDQAKAYYLKSLQIKIELGDRYSQANTYNNLGVVCQIQELWKQANDYYMKALEIFVEFRDDYNIKSTLTNIAKLLHATHDSEIPTAVASIIGITREEAEQLLKE